jgi:hypothetical protein
MKDMKVLHYVRVDVSDYVQACKRLLRTSSEPALTPHEREIILLYARKLIEKVL